MPHSTIPSNAPDLGAQTYKAMFTGPSPYPTRTLGPWLGAALLLLTVVGGWLAAPGTAHADNASLSVRVILASSSGSSVDGALGGIASQLEARFGQYGSFEQLDSQRVSISEGSSRNIGLPNGQSVTLSFQGTSGSSYRISVSLPGGGTTVTVPPGGLFFVAGPSFSGGILIIAISR